MSATIHIAESIRCVAQGLPRKVVVPAPHGKTLRQLAIENGIPPILIVFTLVEGVRRDLEDVLEDVPRGDTSIHFHGSIAGG